MDTEKQLAFRVMEQQDIDEVLTVEQAAFAVPWSREAFLSEIQNPYAEYTVVTVDGQIVGYAGTWIIIDEAHVTNICLLPAYRGQRLGELLLRVMMARAKQSGATRMTLEVRRSNLRAQRLYKRLGFEERGIRKHYYSDTKEDAIIMWLDQL